MERVFGVTVNRQDAVGTKNLPRCSLSNSSLNSLNWAIQCFQKGGGKHTIVAVATDDMVVMSERLTDVKQFKDQIKTF